LSLKLDNSISSPQDLKAMVLEVKTYAKWYNSSSIKLRVNGSTPENQPVLSNQTVALIKSWAADKPLTQDRLDELLEELSEFEKSCPLITVTLAAMPSGELKHKMVDWCRAQIAPNVLVDFRFNSTLLGGMVVKYGSRIYDWSFRRQIIDNRQLFPEVLRRV